MTNQRLVTLLLLCSLLFLIRLYQVGGLSRPEADPFLDSIAANLLPLRGFLSDRIDELMPQPQAALMSGILLGVKSSLPSDLTRALQNTSTIHIVVVSGQNLTLLAGFLMGLVSFLGRKKTVVLALAAICFYSVLTGLQVPVLRAMLMVGMSFLAQLLGKDRWSVWSLFLTGFILLIYNPNYLVSISFQLSFLATLGVIAVSPIILELLKRLSWLGFFKEDLAVSISAQLLTWPIIAAHFHQFSIFGILVNALVLWVVSPVMVIGILALAINLVFSSLAAVVMVPANVLLTYFTATVNLFNNLPFNSMYVGRVNPLVWVGYYLIIGGAIWSIKKYQVAKAQETNNF